MTVETEDVTRVIQRSNELTIEAAKTVIDSAYLAPRQSLELGQAVVRALEANQQLSRDLTERLVRQTFEAQTLWWQFFQTSMRPAFETLTRATGADLATTQDQGRIITAHATAQ